VRNILIAVWLVLQVFTYLGDDSYNCHGFTWDQPGWLNSPMTQKEVGPIVVYFSNGRPIHSGKYLGYGFIMSKWGSNPLVLHPVWLSPYGWDFKYYDLS